MRIFPTIVVQAGGRGSRLRHHTWNKPKCLVSIQGKPILYHLMDRFPDSRFIIIGDYNYSVLEKYLQVNKPPVDYVLIKAMGSGTVSGIGEALKQVDENQPVLIIWGDLLFSGDLLSRSFMKKNQFCVITTKAFTCRWSFDEEKGLVEKSSSINGVPGIFFAPDKSFWKNVPDSGEFVSWLSECDHSICSHEFSQIAEVGDFEFVETDNRREGYTRFFNTIEIGTDRVVKHVTDPRFADVHRNEVQWYKDAQRLGFKRIPKMLCDQPLTLQRLEGRHAYEFEDLSDREKSTILYDYFEVLEDLHSRDQSPANQSHLEQVYVEKTIQRVTDVRLLIPGIDQASITVNGLKCRNPFHDNNRDIFADILSLFTSSTFHPIHGDPTFSNSLIDKRMKIWLIDPRGAFAISGIMGDPLYDFAKVFYSAIGGYDLFNRRRFKLYLDFETVELMYEEPIFRKVGRPVFEEKFSKDFSKIMVIHAMIWLSLSGYVKDDVDSVIAAFYNGIYWLEEALSIA